MSANEKLSEQQREAESKHMQNRKSVFWFFFLKERANGCLGRIRCFWLRGGTVLAGRLVKCPNQFHSVEDAPGAFSTQIKTFSGHVGSDTPNLQLWLSLRFAPGVPSQQIYRELYGLVVSDVVLLSSIKVIYIYQNILNDTACPTFFHRSLCDEVYFGSNCFL